MSDDRSQERRAFRPTLDGRLEPRLLLARAAGMIRSSAADGGQTARINDADGDVFEVTITGAGTVRGIPARGGRVNLIVQGTTLDSELAINPVLGRAITRGQAHSGPRRDGLLHVNSIRVATGTIGSILGYRSANLSGPIALGSTNRVDRIAFNSIRPGGSISAGGDLNTLDILNNANFSAAQGLAVGRDLNSLSVGQDLLFSNGAGLVIGRDLGATPQPAKGTGPDGQGVLINGNLALAEDSSILIGRDLAGNFQVDGQASGTSRITIGRGGSGQFIIRGGFTS